MKILHVIKRMDLAGGAERMISEIIKHEQDHFVLFYAGQDSFYSIPPEKAIRARNLLHALLKCYLIKSQFDCIHLHLFPTVYFSALLGSKSVIHEHSTYNGRRKFILARPIEALIYRRAACVIAISAAVKQSLTNWLGYKDGIVVLNNFVTPLPKEYVVKEVSKRTMPRRILMVASFRPSKRQDLLIEAVPYLPEDIEIRFAGEGPNLVHMQTLVDNMGLKNRVSFLGNVENIRKEYEGAQLCVLFSDWEGFGLVIVEAAQHGLVTLVCNVPGARDIVPDKNWIIDSEAPNAIAQKITSFLEHHTASCDQKSLEKYTRQFELQKYLSNLRTIYKDWLQIK